MIFYIDNSTLLHKAFLVFLSVAIVGCSTAFTSRKYIPDPYSVNCNQFYVTGRTIYPIDPDMLGPKTKKGEFNFLINAPMKYHAVPDIKSPPKIFMRNKLNGKITKPIDVNIIDDRISSTGKRYFLEYFFDIQWEDIGSIELIFSEPIGECKIPPFSYRLEETFKLPINMGP